MNRHPSIEPRFLTRKQAADYLGLGEHIFAIEVDHGRWPGPSFGLGRSRRWDKRAIDRRADEISGLSESALPPGIRTDAEAAALAHIAGVR